MHDEFVEAFSSQDARQEAERHRRNLAETLDMLTDRVGSAIDALKRQVTLPKRWAADHPLVTFGLSVTIGLLLGARSRRPEMEHTGALAHGLEGVYLQGRRDESEQRPPRDPEYWAGMKLGDGPALGGALLEVAKPFLVHLARALAESLQSRSRDRETRP